MGSLSKQLEDLALAHRLQSRVWPAEGAGTKGKKTPKPMVFNNSLTGKKGKRFKFQLNEHPSQTLKILNIRTPSFTLEQLLDRKGKRINDNNYM